MSNDVFLKTMNSLPTTGSLVMLALVASFLFGCYWFGWHILGRCNGRMEDPLASIVLFSFALGALFILSTIFFVSITWFTSFVAVAISPLTVVAGCLICYVACGVSMTEEAALIGKITGLYDANANRTPSPSKVERAKTSPA